MLLRYRYTVFVYCVFTLCIGESGTADTGTTEIHPDDIPDECPGSGSDYNNGTCPPVTGSCANIETRLGGDVTLLDYRVLGCYCDEWCQVYGDCCRDKNIENEYLRLDTDVFQCTTDHKIKDLQLPVYVINRCPKPWKHAAFKNKCESPDPDPYLHLPVSDARGFLYKNLYCAICNGVGGDDMHFWLANIECSAKYYELLNEASPESEAGGNRSTAFDAGGNSVNTSRSRSPESDAVENKEHVASLKNQLLTGECKIKYSAPRIKSRPTAGSQAAGSTSDQEGPAAAGAATPAVLPQVFRTCKQAIIKCASSWPGDNGSQNRCIGENCEPGCIGENCESISSERNRCIREMCESVDSVQYVYLDYPGGTVYKNDFCAKCNFVPKDYLTCVQNPVFLSNRVFLKIYPLAIVMDLNDGGTSAMRTRVGFELSREKKRNAVRMLRCPENHVYDPFSKECIALTCSEGFQYIGTECKKIQTAKSAEMLHSESDCLRIAVSEYELFENGSVYVESTNRLYNVEEYGMNNEGQVLLCNTDFSQNYTNSTENNANSLAEGQELVLKFSWALTIVSAVGQVLSIIGLIILLVVYSLLPKLRNVPGRNLMCLSASLLVAQVLFLTGVGATGTPEVCVVISLLLHFSFLAAFFWNSVMSFDIWRTFSHDKVTLGTNNKKFLFYSLYAWLSPVAIVTLSAILNWSPSVDFHYRPGYGDGLCWITQRMALLVLFGVPLALLLTTNIAFYILTVKHLVHITKTTKIIEKNDENKHRFLLYVKLSAIMGLTWIFGFIAALAEAEVTWYLFVIFNSLQGAFICLSFVITRKVWRLLVERFGTKRDKKDTRDTSRTRSTSLSTDLYHGTRIHGNKV